MLSEQDLMGELDIDTTKFPHTLENGHCSHLTIDTTDACHMAHAHSVAVWACMYPISSLTRAHKPSTILKPQLCKSGVILTLPENV